MQLKHGWDRVLALHILLGKHYITLIEANEAPRTGS